MSELWTLARRIELREPWLLVVSLAALLVLALALRPGGRLIFSSLSLLPRRAKTWRTRLSWLPAALLAVATILMAIAVAGPRLPDRSERVQREGIAIMMVADISGSMRALDLSGGDPERSRLEVVKDVFIDFVRPGGDLAGRPDDAVGIVSFAGFADTRCPLTFDHEILTALAEDLQIVTERREDGTALGDGLGLAVERLRQSAAQSKVAILLTDGVQNAGEEAPMDAAELARTLGVKVYTVGAGTNGLAPVPVRDPFTGEMTLSRQQVTIDEDTLRAVAEHTGGRYFRATDEAGLQEVYSEIDRLERTELGEERFARYRELFAGFLALALVLAALAWLLEASYLRRLP